MQSMSDLFWTGITLLLVMGTLSIVTTNWRLLKPPRPACSISVRKLIQSHVQVSHLGRVWRYSVSWYRDPALLDSIILVKSRPRDVTRTLDIKTWTNFQHVAASAHSLPIALYVQVSVIFYCPLSLPIHICSHANGIDFIFVDIVCW